MKTKYKHYVKSVQIGSFFRSVFSLIWTEYGDLRSISYKVYHIDYIIKHIIIVLSMLLLVPEWPYLPPNSKGLAFYKSYFSKKKKC